MQKLITLVPLLLIFSSCGPTLRTEADMGLLSTHGMVKQQFQGHTYVITKGVVSPTHTMHDPDCLCTVKPQQVPSIQGPTAPEFVTPIGAPKAPYAPSDIEMRVDHPLTSTLRITKPVVTLVKPVLSTPVER